MYLALFLVQKMEQVRPMRSLPSWLVFWLVKTDEIRWGGW